MGKLGIWQASDSSLTKELHAWTISHTSNYYLPSSLSFTSTISFSRLSISCFCTPSTWSFSTNELPVPDKENPVEKNEGGFGFREKDFLCQFIKRNIFIGKIFILMCNAFSEWFRILNLIENHGGNCGTVGRAVTIGFRWQRSEVQIQFLSPLRD